MIETEWSDADKSVIAKTGADDGIRTRDLRFTKPLLYQLSYVGTERPNIASVDRASKRVK